MGWEGRQLKSAGKNGTNLSFTYDSEGIRTSKTVGSTTTKYLLNGTQILAQTTNGITTSFFYDQQGNRVAMADSSNHFYYYIYNLQGDVIALADASTGKLVVTYTYDAWGKIVRINGQNPEDVASTNIANINPFRYRGYYYDTETGLYYLQSRYYDPEICRFINADAFTSTDISGVLSANMFAYCENRPTIGSDPTGEWVQLVVGAAVGAIMGGVSAAISSYRQTGSVDVGSVIFNAATGAIGGFVGATGLGAAAQYAVSGAIGAASEVYDAIKEKRGVNVLSLATNAAIGIGGSAVGSAVTSKAARCSEKLIDKGVNKIVECKAKFDSGDRYWKGGMKKGVRWFREGVRGLHIAQGKSSVIGSVSGGALSILKSLIFG